MATGDVMLCTNSSWQIMPAVTFFLEIVIVRIVFPQTLL